MVARGCARPSNLTTVIGPVQQRLPLPRPAHRIARRAMSFNLRDVPPNGLPTFDLPGIFFRHAAAHIVPAIPLEPAAWIVRVNPSFSSPGRKRLTRVDAEIIEAAIAPRR